ncbi:MAG: hypothetical protein WAS36_02265 [Candidatus Saccharimonadales bacterium]
MNPSTDKDSSVGDSSVVPLENTQSQPTVIQPTSTNSSTNVTPFSEPDFTVSPAASASSGVSPSPSRAFEPSAPTTAPMASVDGFTASAATTSLDITSQAPVAVEVPVSQPVQPATPTQQPASVVFASDETAFTPETPPVKKSKKKLYIIGGSVGLMLLLVATGVFGFYLPNRPSAVWNTGINRTGKALDSVVQSATEKKTLETLSTSKISGELNATYQGSTYKGTVTTKFKDNDSDTGVTVAMKSTDVNMNVGLKVLTETVKDSSYPNAYFQFTGLKELGILDMASPGLGEYEGKWISIPAATYQKWIQQISGEESEAAKYSSADIAEISQTVIAVTNNYVFSTDPEKAVLKQNSFVGKETVDDIKTYHYKVSVNQEHAKDYCVALVNEVTKTKAFKNLTGYSDEDVNSTREDGVKSCKDDAAKQVKESDEYDMWIDGKYKLIYKVRVNDKDAKGDYQEFGQRYTGGDVLTFFYNLHSEENKGDVKVSFVYNAKTFVTTMTLDGESKSKENPSSLDAKVTFEPSNDEVKITAPKDAVPIETILQQLGIALPEESTEVQGAASGSLKARAQDAERQTDINALHNHAQMNYALNGTYPTLAQFNNADYRNSNLKALDSEALKDPGGTSQGGLVGAKTANKYAYIGTGCTTDGCDSYTLVAVLSDGSTYEKQPN